MSDSLHACPYCDTKMEADFVDVGVGYVQCGPYHCYSCGASEIGPELWDWHYKDREGETIYLPGKRIYFEHAKKKLINRNESVLKWNHPFTERELETGYYQGKISPYANTVGGQLVDHILAKEAYNVGLLDDKDLPKEDSL
ncbi:hypothetical protein [Exiguobacterium sp. s102]|uniref:hypothetical protein n=1 Tax=Exiguobacterium sp. s102 TaxID=2751212 RepID=UPI001BE86F14|nr:hypothetical protein [Exiguobacterium sp. s102]